MTEAAADAPVETSALDDILARWHAWARGYSPAGRQGACPMFRQARSSRGWDDTADIIDAEVHQSTMEAVDFQVGEMQDPHRAAIHAHARNLHTGRSVWPSPRLPADPMERAVILLEAMNQLMRRLMAAGVL